MFGRTKMFTFTGTSLKESSLDSAMENFYHQMRGNGFVPIAGTEDFKYGEEGEFSVSWTLNIIGKECDSPWEVRYVTSDGDIEWFTTQRITSAQSLTL